MVSNKTLLITIITKNVESDKIASSGFIFPTPSFLRIKFYSEVSLCEIMSECTVCVKRAIHQ